MPVTKPLKLVKTANEVRTFGADFANKGEVADNSETLASGEAIAITPTTSPALTVASVARSGTKVTGKFSAGKDGTTYNVTFQVVTSGSHTLEIEALIAVGNRRIGA